MAGDAPSLHRWVVAGALILSDAGEVLLVENRRRGGRRDWSPPGGVVDGGESVLEGLTREVEEETGLCVSAWAGPVYEVHCRAPDMGWDLRVEVHQALRYHGDLRIDDPDGIVVDAEFVAAADCGARLSGGQPWVCEPLTAWLAERWDPGAARPFHFHVAGRDPASLVVTRASP